jgi:hypothetical protein
MAQSMAHCDKDGYTEIDEVDNERDDIDNTGVANHCSIVPKREHEVRVKMTTEIRGYAPSFTLRHFTWHLGISQFILPRLIWSTCWSYHQSYLRRSPISDMREWAK